MLERFGTQGQAVVIATPGRLHDVVQRGEILIQTVKYVLLDEADELLPSQEIEAIGYAGVWAVGLVRNRPNQLVHDVKWLGRHTHTHARTRSSPGLLWLPPLQCVEPHMAFACALAGPPASRALTE